MKKNIMEILWKIWATLVTFVTMPFGIIGGIIQLIYVDGLEGIREIPYLFVYYFWLAPATIWIEGEKGYLIAFLFLRR